MDFFFFGSLMDPDVVDLVFGRPVSASDRQAATAEGFRRVLLAGEGYPVMIPRAGGQVDGILIRGITPAEKERLVWFEDGEYDIAEIALVLGDGRRRQALTCLRRPETAIQEGEWSLARWQHEDKAAFLARAGLWMSLLGLATVAEAEAAWQALKQAQGIEQAARSAAKRIDS